MEMNNKGKYDRDDLDNIIDEILNKDNSFQFTFEEFWEDIKAFAEQNRLSTGYVEDEFILDGELVPVHLQWQDELNEELWKARVDEHDRLAEDEKDFLGDPPIGEAELDRIIDDILAHENDKEWDDPLM